MAGKLSVKQLEKRVAWGFIGTTLTAISLVVAVVTLREKRPEISVMTVSESNVLDVHAPVAALDVVYNGVSLQQRKLNLKILVVRIENTGDADVLQFLYDAELPWGLRIKTGRIVAVRLTGASSMYLRDRLLPAQMLPAEFIQLRKVIFERGSFATLELLVLHRRDMTPAIETIGKIAGTRFLNAIVKPDGEPSGFLAKTFRGTAATQVVRLLVYGVLFLFALALMMFIFVELFELALSRPASAGRPRELRSVFRTISIDRESRIIISGVYLRGGVSGLEGFRALLVDAPRLREFLETMADDIRRAERNLALVALRRAQKGRSVELSLSQALFAMEDLRLLHRTRSGETEFDSRFLDNLSLAIESLSRRSG